MVRRSFVLLASASLAVAAAALAAPARAVLAVSPYQPFINTQQEPVPLGSAATVEIGVALYGSSPGLPTPAAWSFYWGDSAIPVVGTGSPGGTLTHTYTSPGVHTVRLSVVDSQLNTGTVTDTVVVLPTAPERAVSLAEPRVLTRTPTASLAGKQLLADVNGDGIPDLVLAGTGAGATATSLTVALGTGHGGFGTPHRTGTGSQDILDAAIGDFNGDGKPDVVVTQTPPGPEHDTVTVLLGNGRGGFTHTGQAVPGGTGLAVADIDHDGHLDVVFSGGVLRGDGTGHLSVVPVRAAVPPPVTDTVFADPASVVGDLDGDGVPDAVLQTRHGIQVILQRADGTRVTLPEITLPGEFPGATPEAVQAVDLNHDGHLDLVVERDTDGPPPGFGPWSNDVVTLLGDGTGHFTVAADLTFPGDHPIAGVSALADLNGDGAPDLVAPGWGILLGNGHGGFDVQPESLPGVPLITDLNRDGKPDLVIREFARQGSTFDYQDELYLQN